MYTVQLSVVSIGRKLQIDGISDTSFTVASEKLPILRDSFARESSSFSSNAKQLAIK